jgi:acyl-CoA dehydrogenase
MERVLEVVLAHVRDRVQFGRPIGRFQAVQHLVADIAAETALARAATDAAVARAAASDWQDRGMLFAVGVAKSCVGHGASVVVRNAHQVLGAIGTTLEHELHTLTKPILARRSEYGSVHEWDETLTVLATSAGHERLWTLVTTGRAKSRDYRTT